MENQALGPSTYRLAVSPRHPYIRHMSSNATDSTRRGPADPAFRRQISYIDRSRDYYKAKGFEIPYRWIKHSDAPFTPLTKPLSECKIGVVTTAFPNDEAKEVGAHPASPIPSSMFTNDLFWHKKATTTDDVNTFLPLTSLERRRHAGTIGSVSDRFYCVPTLHSHRRSRSFAEQVTELCLQDELDAVVLVPL